MSNTNMLSRTLIQIGGPDDSAVVDHDADADDQNYRPTENNCVASLGVAGRGEDLGGSGSSGGSDGTKNNKVAVRPKTVNFTSLVDTTALLNTPSLITSCALTPSMFTGSGLTTPLTFLSNGGFTFGAAPLLYSPATYANLEQTLLQLERQQANAGVAQTAVNLSKEGSAVIDISSIAPPTASTTPMAPTVSIKREHEPDTDDSDDDSTSERDWSNNQSSGGRRMNTGEGAVDYSVTSPGYSSTDSGAANTSVNGGTSKTRRATGPRRSRNHVKLTPEEEERRNVRRERNKHAAAKCRQKRVDQTNQLLEETQGLEEEQNRLQEEIKTFQQEKEELEFILEAHRLHCGVGSNDQSSVGNHITTYSLPEIRVGEPATHAPYQDVGGPSSTTSTGGGSYSVPPQSVTMMNNVPLMTSSGEVYILGFDSMSNGQARLTPITVKPDASPTHAAGLSVAAGLHVVQNLSNKSFQSDEMMNSYST